MSNMQEKEPLEKEANAAQALEDHRKPYDPPKLLKKRSVARAITLSSPGTASAGVAAMMGP